MAISLANDVTRHRLGPNISPSPLGSPLDQLLGSYAQLPIPFREEQVPISTVEEQVPRKFRSLTVAPPIPSLEEQVLLGRAIRRWLDWDPAPEKAPHHVQRAGRRARDRMVAGNMKLVAKQARSFSVTSVVALEVQDLIQEGVLGLTRAAELFEPEKGYAFSTYAVWWIRQSMSRLIHTSGSIRIPAKRSSKMSQLRQWVEAFTAREGRSPTDQEAMEGMGLSAADLRILRQAATVRQVSSLDALMGDGEGDTVITSLADPTTTADAAERAEVLEALKLWPELRVIMELGLAGHTCQEAGLAMGITPLAAERLWERALAKAQDLMAG